MNIKHLKQSVNIDAIREFAQVKEKILQIESEIDELQSILEDNSFLSEYIWTTATGKCME